MGKRLRQQRRGKGSSTYRARKPKYNERINHKFETTGVVKDIFHASGRRSPVAKVEFEDETKLMLAHHGMSTGDEIKINGDIEQGNILKLKDIPPGTKLYNIEGKVGDGGEFCRSAGAFAVMVSRGEKKCVLKLPSKKTKVFPAECKATIGKVAGAGKVEKPFLKAGQKYKNLKSLGHKYPKMSGVAMNPVDHPFGGSNLGKSKTVSRNASPGRKVGSISSKRTGKSE